MLIMVVILIFFGANKIPELARGLGKGIREFKDASREIRSEFENHVESQPQQPYQQQFNPNYIAPSAPAPAPEHLPDDAYTQSEPTHSSPGTTYTPPVAHVTLSDSTTPTPAERPRLDQMS